MRYFPTQDAKALNLPPTTLRWLNELVARMTYLDGVVVPITYHVDAIATKVGTTPTGDESDVALCDDGNVFLVTEVVGAATLPVSDATTGGGFNINFTFEDVTDFDKVVIRTSYDGASSHVIGIYLYDNTDADWHRIFSITDQNDYYDQVHFVCSADRFINNGQVKVKIFHESNGNAAHHIHIDYVALEAEHVMGFDLAAPSTSHLSLSDVGTNTHADIDTHIGTTFPNHDHTGGNGADISYNNLIDVPATFTPAAHGHTAVSGSFTTVDNKTVTVTNGIISSIV